MSSDRKVGRPRAARQPAAGVVAEDILAAARALFRAKGYAATSTREIAAAVGLRQPSLFHYFASKQAIFRAVALGAVQPVLDFIRAERRRRLPPDVALYRLIRFDTYHLCTNENALGSPFQFPELAREQQPEFWALREEIVAAYRRELERGARQGWFAVEDAVVVTHLLFALGESTLTWYRGRSRRVDPVQVAGITAALALRAVLADPGRLPEIRRAAGAMPESGG